MKVTGLSIPTATVVNVTHSRTLFCNGTATVENVIIQFDSQKFIDKFSGTISFDRKEAKKLIRELQSQLKIRKSSDHVRWIKRRSEKQTHP